MFELKKDHKTSDRTQEINIFLFVPFTYGMVGNVAFMCPNCIMFFKNKKGTLFLKISGRHGICQLPPAENDADIIET